MGQIHLELFATLDLVGQAPGGPDEDPDGRKIGFSSAAAGHRGSRDRPDRPSGAC